MLPTRARSLAAAAAFSAFLSLVSVPAGAQAIPTGYWQGAYYSWFDFAEDAGFSFDATAVPPAWVFQRQPVMLQNDSAVNFDWGWENGPAGMNDYFAVRWQSYQYLGGT